MIRVTTWDGDNNLALLRASAIMEVYAIGNSSVVAVVTTDTVYYVKETVEEVEAIIRTEALLGAIPPAAAGESATTP